MVAGRWTFAVEVDGARLVEVPFEVGVPGAEARVDSVCLSALSAEADGTDVRPWG